MMFPSKHIEALCVFFVLEQRKLKKNQWLSLVWFLETQTDRFYRKVANQCLHCSEVDEWFYRNDKRHFIKKKVLANWLSSLSSLHTAGIHVGGENWLTCHRALRQRSVLLHHASAQQAVRWGRPVWLFTCFLLKPPNSELQLMKRISIPPSFQTCFVLCQGTNQMGV